MKQIKTKSKEPYEAPVVLDITPVTIIAGKSPGPSAEPDVYYDDEGNVIE